MTAQQTAPTVVSDPIPPHLRDGYEIHRAALRHGLDVTLYPRQVLMARHPDGGPELSFVHGIPQPSTLAAVTYAQDKHMRRELLARAGLPVPEGAVFAMRDAHEAIHYARKVGYPVAVKPAVGDNLNQGRVGIRNEQELQDAIAELRVHEDERRDYTRTAYGLTFLSEPEEVDGQLLAPLKYPFLVERDVAGERVRVLATVDGAISAVRWPGEPDASGARYVEFTAQLDRRLSDAATRAVSAVPGLWAAAVDIAVEHTADGSRNGHAWITEMSERPWLDIQARASEDASRRAGEALLKLFARESSVVLAPPQDAVAGTLLIEGASDPDGLVTAVQAAANRLGLDCSVAVKDRVDGTVGGTLRGSADLLAWLAESLVDGRLDDQRAMLVEILHARQG